MSSPTEKLTAFTAWAQAHITGDEKGQAQIFLDRLFIAYGFTAKADLLAQNQQVAAKLERAEPVTAPASPPVS